MSQNNETQEMREAMRAQQKEACLRLEDEANKAVVIANEARARARCLMVTAQLARSGLEKEEEEEKKIAAEQQQQQAFVADTPVGGGAWGIARTKQSTGGGSNESGSRIKTDIGDYKSGEVQEDLVQESHKFNRAQGGALMSSTKQ
eukprot:gene2822-12567_t